MSDELMWVPDVSRNAILTEIREHLDAVRSWGKFDDPSNSYKYYIKAEALIELLETQDCGSVGGFGKRIGPKGEIQEQHNIQRYTYTLENRYRWLAEMSHGTGTSRARLRPLEVKGTK
jgi:hypothetical protein